MPKARTSDGVELYYEINGSLPRKAGKVARSAGWGGSTRQNGAPILFIHEFAGDHRSWAHQVSHFEKFNRCIVYAARGYPPSDVPIDPAAYSQQRAVDDAVEVWDAALRPHGKPKGAGRVVGISMGGFTALHMVLQHPDRVHAA